MCMGGGILQWRECACRSGMWGWMRNESHFTERWQRRAGDAGEFSAGRQRCLREREREVKALAQALEGQEGVRGEVACGHLTVGLLVAARWTLALKPADKQVDAGAAVLAHSWNTTAGTGRQLAALSWTQMVGERERWRGMRINIVCDKQHRLKSPRGFHLRDFRQYSFFLSQKLSFLCTICNSIHLTAEINVEYTAFSNIHRMKNKW